MRKEYNMGTTYTCDVHVPCADDRHAYLETVIDRWFEVSALGNDDLGALANGDGVVIVTIQVEAESEKDAARQALDLVTNATASIGDTTGIVFGIIAEDAIRVYALNPH